MMVNVLLLWVGEVESHNDISECVVFVGVAVVDEYLVDWLEYCALLAWSIDVFNGHRERSDRTTRLISRRIEFSLISFLY